MIYLLYIVLVPLNLLATLLAVILSPIMPIFATQQEGYLNNGSAYGMGPRLPKWLSWFQTWDNSLDGDATFVANNPPSYVSKIKWLVRNPAPSVALRTLTSPYDTSYKGDPSIKDNDNAKAGWLFVKVNGLFQYACVKRILSTDRCFYVNLGWNIRALVDPNVHPGTTYIATFVFSPRISGFR
ncbi:MAG: DUF7338 family protein [Methylococcales bacterium]